MEAMEASALEAAVLWLAQTILANLLLDKLDEWLRQVGLADDIQELKVEIEKVEGVVSAGKGRAVGNRQLARLLARLKELLYDADDVVDELDYYRLKHEVEEVTFACTAVPESTNGDGGEQVDESRANANAGMPSSSDLKLRSEAWKDFRITDVLDGKPLKAECIHCGTTVRCETSKGTSVLRNHIKSASCKRRRAATEQTVNPASRYSYFASDQQPSIGSGTDSISKKRTRVDEELTHNTVANPHPWDKAGFSNAIQQITRQLQDIRLELNDIHSVSSANLNHHQNSTTYQRLRTSSLAPRKVYGREKEKDYIIRVMRAEESNTLTVLPIVGIGGVGKTALAQLIYDDPAVKDQYERVWAWVSNEFDKVIATRDMLDFFSQESHYKISNYAKLQEILKGHMEHRSKRFLLILDDVWGSMDYDQWDELLAPLQSSPKKGNMIIVTTRNLFFAQRIGTAKPMKLGGLEENDVWSLLKAFAFGDDDYKGNQTLEKIGSRIVKKLKGSPLAAETAGNILRKCLTAEHWNNIMENEDWKSLQHSRGIMASLKLSYDQLSYELQQCFLYCSIFPYNYQFVAEDLIDIWISQGFVLRNNSSKIEETGWKYLSKLVGSGFFEYVDIKDSQIYHVMMPALMHDFARLVSRTECAVIDSVECNEIPSTIHHVSILTDSAYHKEGHPGDIHRNEGFEEKVQSVMTPVRKLRTLLLIGKCDHFFLQSFQHILEKAKYLRILQISSRYASFDDAFLPNSVNSTHIRYLKVETEGSGVIPVSKFYHLEVLDAGDAAIHGHMNGLISMRRLVVKKGPRSSITGIDETSHPQESHSSTDQHSGIYKIRQLQSMNKLVHLQLGNVARAKADGAKVLRDKQHLQKLQILFKNMKELQLSWENRDEHDDDEEGSSQMNDTSSEDFNEINNSNNIPSSSNFADTESDVLEGLEPHLNLKYLQISGYSGATSPAWLVSSVTNLRALHLEDCGEWQILPSLEILPFLIKLKLENMKKVIELSIPSLEVLVLSNLPKLELCSCNSVMDLSSSLRVLSVRSCHVLKSFPLFESCEKFNIEQKSWLCRLDELVIDGCSQLKISNHLPPSSTVSKLRIRDVLEIPDMYGSPDKSLEVSSTEVGMLDGKWFAYHNLRMLTELCISFLGTVDISFQGFRQLINLKDLQIEWCSKILSSHVVQDPTDEYMAAGNDSALPSLRCLSVSSCGIMGKWMSVLLRHVKAVEEFSLHNCQQITTLSIEEEESNLSDLRSGLEASSSGNSYNNALAVPPSDSLLCMPSNLLSSVKKMSIMNCRELIYQGSKVGFARFTSLEELEIILCPKLIPSLVHSGENYDSANGKWFLPLSLCSIRIDEAPETLQLCFPENRSYLRKLQVESSPLKSLQLHSCTALEKLEIRGCDSLVSLEGLQSLGGLTALKVFSCPGLPDLEHLSRQGLGYLRLERLDIDKFSFLSMPVWMRLASLKRLEFSNLRVTGLSDWDGRAL
ncbi:hypothetical protein EJB05_38330 [Eragrostis curvula]|uniref:BED-type domain-containing protein n=1 Tax=Eragrostis curvula TaxID=38414 RepID=A0A5J9TTZ6_9POAL|nr:hypothetical protein EJB05_38330 [Eragrostis curvula]